jgi:hypothetical protein
VRVAIFAQPGVISRSSKCQGIVGSCQQYPTLKCSILRIIGILLMIPGFG